MRRSGFGKGAGGRRRAMMQHTHPNKKTGYVTAPDSDDPPRISMASPTYDECTGDDDLTPEKLVAMASQGSRNGAATSLTPKKNAEDANIIAPPINAKSSIDENDNDDAAAATMPALQRGRRFVSPGAFPSGVSDDGQNELPPCNTAFPIEAVLVRDDGSFDTETVDEEDDDNEMVSAELVEVSAITKAEPAWPLQKWAQYGMASLCLLTTMMGLVLVLVLVLQASRSKDDFGEAAITVVQPTQPNLITFYSHHAAVLANQLNATENCRQVPTSAATGHLEFVLQCERKHTAIVIHTWDEETVTLAEPGGALQRRTVYLNRNSMGFVAFHCMFQVPLPDQRTIKDVAENELVTASPASVRLKEHQEKCSEGGTFIRLLRHCGEFPLPLAISCTGAEGVHKGLCVQESHSCKAGAASCIPSFTSTDSSWCPTAVSPDVPDSFVNRRIIERMDEFRSSFAEVLGD